MMVIWFFFFKQKTAYEMRISDWSSDVCSSDLQKALVGAHFKLLARLLVDVRRAIDGELLDPCRQRNRPPDKRTGALGGIGDFPRGLIQHSVIECLQANSYILRFHRRYRQSKEPTPKGQSKQDRPIPLRENRAVGSRYIT